MNTTARLMKWGVVLSLLAACTNIAGWGQEVSHARIVRLSFTEGTVTIQRPDVDEWATAPVNTPIQEGFKLATAESAFAEVEFENASTARLGQNSLLEFTQLALAASGAKLNRMNLVQGYATFNVIPEDDDFYEVTVGDATLTCQSKARLRVDVEDGAVQVKVFKGSVDVMSPEGNGTLARNTVLVIQPGAEEPFLTSQGITKDAWDSWVEERENRVELARNQEAPSLYSNNVSDLLYGSMDLLYFGNWVSLPGYGNGWVPRVGMGWAPFTAGRWAWYPSMGYTWISYEPWGWLPYHYGSWIYDPAYGWCWVPMGGFAAWSPAPVNWYRGPGWVGWSPLSPVGGGGSANCPSTRGCVAIASEDALRFGQPIRADGIRWASADVSLPSRQIDVQPAREARLVGAVAVGMDGFRRPPGEGASRPIAVQGSAAPAAGSSATGTTGRTPAATPQIVFDAERHQYVNNPAQPSPPRAPAAPAAAPARQGAPSAGDMISGRAPSAGQASRPAPRTNYPDPAVLDSDRPGPETGRSFGRNAGTPRSAEPDRGSDRGGFAIGIRGGPSRSSEQAAPVRSSPSPSTSRAESSARSSIGSGSSSSSGGGQSSGGSSGSSHSSSGGGGSSGGGHSGGGTIGGGGGGGHSGGGGSHSSNNSKH